MFGGSFFKKNIKITPLNNEIYSCKGNLLFVPFEYKNLTMDTKNKLTELNRETVEKLEAFMKEKGSEGRDHEKIHSAKEEWQLAWNKLMEALLILEKLEI